MSDEKKSYISGIYNYCDRWCERCSFTSNCYLFTTESRITTHEIMNDGEFPKPEDIFPPIDADEDENEELLFDEEDDEDFEFEDDDYDDESIKEEMEEERRFLEQNNSPLEELSDSYMETAHELLKALDTKYGFYENANKNFDEAEFKKLHNAFEIFAFYHMFIHVKYKRAVHAKLDVLREDDPEMNDMNLYDMNGTAKIATISVNNSINALNELYHALPEFEKAISELLILLGKIKNESDKEFPDCMSFKRPGLDE